MIHIYAKQAILKNLTLHIKEGEVYGLLGHNGCGKTTALNIFSGQI
jgi:ABC-type multidrug transport system ATPase subunit